MNPVPVMTLVEIVRGLATSDETYQTTKQLAESLGKTPVEVNDFPGFVSNRVLMPMINEAIYCVMEGVGTAEAIDSVMKLGMNHPMGPLALADLIGLDVCLDIMEVLHERSRRLEIPALSAFAQDGGCRPSGKENPDRDSINIKEFGPALSVKVGSYRYDSLSELHDTKFSEPGLLLEVRLQAAGAFRRGCVGFGDSVHGRTRPRTDQRTRILHQHADQARRFDDGNHRARRGQQFHRSHDDRNVDRFAGIRRNRSEKSGSRVAKAHRFANSGNRRSRSSRQPHAANHGQLPRAPIESSSHCGWKNRTTCSSPTAAPKASTS